MRYWIGNVLGQVGKDCYRRGEPLLSALCVRANGMVGDGYSWVVAETYGGEPPEDLEMHAAEERLKCYRHWGAPLPPGGGQPALTPEVARRRAAERRRRAPQPAPVLCPTCNMHLPRSGHCDMCN